MSRIYCISGLGADEKIFCNLNISGFTLQYMPWLKPKPKETIVQYSKRMAVSIEDSQPVLLGVSFGGMVAIEISKHIRVSKLIIISGIKTSKELPSWMRIAGKLRLNKILPVKSNKLTEKFDNEQLGVTTEEERILVNHYRKIADSSYLNWAIHEVLNWKNDSHPEAIFHIHGNRDKMFPIRNIKPTHIIEGGTHIMILNRAEEVSKCINTIMQTQQTLNKIFEP